MLQQVVNLKLVHKKKINKKNILLLLEVLIQINGLEINQSLIKIL
jgi:hypothetical protein